MILDNLTILIDADARGIDNILKKTIQTVTGTVDKMNQQEVDWTSIFTRSVTPAIIAGVASMFAFAIGQSLQFQQAMATSGTAAGESTSQIAQTGAAALQMGSDTGQSATSIAQAMMQVSSIFGVNTDATNQITQAMIDLSQSGFGPLSDIVQAVIPLFKEFGVTTSQDAIAMLTSLMHGAQGSKESISDLAGQFDKFSPALVAAGANVGSFNGLISDFSGRIQALGQANASAVFQALASSSNNVVGPMELLGQNIGKVQSSIVSGNVTGLIDTLAGKLDKMGTVAQIVAQNMGLSADQVNQFKITAKQLPTVDKDIQTIATSTMSIADATNQSSSALRDFQKDWQKLVQLVTSGNIASVFDGIAKSIGTVIDAMNNLVNGKAGEMLFDLINGKGNLQAIGNAISPLIPSPNTVVQPQAFSPSTNDAVQKALLGSNQGFSNSALSSIDSKATSSNLVQALVQALSSGLSSSNASYNQLHNTFNLSVPQGGSITSKDVATQLYKMFQGTQK